MVFTMTTPLGDLLEKAEQQRGTTKGEAADLMGISRQAYLGWKRGAQPRLECLPAISAFCNVPVSVVLAAVGIDADQVYEIDDIPGYRESAYRALVIPFVHAA